MRFMSRSRGRVFALGLLLWLVSAGVGAQPLDEARGALARGDGEQAYALLSPLQSQHAGEADYDYLLGLAALESGRAPEAVFALERAMVVAPEDARARAAMVRALVAVGELGEAEALLAGLREVAPAEAEAVAAAEAAVRGSRRGRMASRRVLSAYVELAAGYDSNVNSGAGDAAVSVPGTGALALLDPSGVEADDGFVGTAAGASYVHPLTPVLDVFGRVSAQVRRNVDERAFDTDFATGQAGLRAFQGEDTFTLSLLAQHFRADRDRFRNAYGVSAQWDRNLTRAGRLSGFAQYWVLDYAQRIRDADRKLLGVSYTHLFGGALRPELTAGVYGGVESEQETGVAHLGHDFVGARVGGQLRARANVMVFANIGVEARDYGGREPFFNRGRDDTRYTGEIGVHYTPHEHWRITPRVVHVRQDSNVPIFDHDRTVVSVTVRRNF